MRNRVLSMNARQRNLANGLSLQLKRSRESLFDLLDRMENFEGAHADIAYRLIQMAYDATGNIQPEDLVEIAKANLD